MMTSIPFGYLIQTKSRSCAPLRIAAPDSDARQTPLLVTINNASPGQVVGRKLHGHPVARKNLDEVLAHLARYMGQDLVLVLQFHLEHGIGQWLDHHRHHFNRVFLTHSTPVVSSRLSVVRLAAQSELKIRTDN